MLNCSSTNLVDVTIEGDNQCNNCDYIWSPSQYLDDPTIEFPTILGSINGIALDQTYYVEASNEYGCSDRDTVEIYDLTADVEVEIKLFEYCSYELFAALTVNEELSSDLVSAVFTNLTTGNQYDGIIVDDPIVGTEFIFKGSNPLIPTDIGVVDNWRVRFIISQDGAENNTVIGNNCSLSADFPTIGPTNLYYGDFGEFEIKNVITPNGDGVNDEACVETVDLPPLFTHNAYYGKMIIKNQWGDTVYEVEAFGDPNNLIPFPDSDLCWDGTFSGNGEDVPAGTYWWLLWFKNCDNPGPEGENGVYMGTNYIKVVR